MRGEFGRQIKFALPRGQQYILHFFKIFFLSY